MQIPWRSQTRRAGSIRPTGSLPTAAVCLVTLSLAGLVAQLAFWRWGGDPAEEALGDWGALSRAGMAAGRFWQPFTYIFLPSSASWLLLVDLPILWLAGRHLERILGRRHLVTIFLVPGALGGLVQLGFQWFEGGRLDVMSGPEASVLAVFVALACAAPEMDIIPPLSLAVYGGSGRWRIKHGAFFAVLAGAGALGTATCKYQLSGDPGAAPLAARLLTATAVAALYLRQLGFGRAPSEPGGHDIPETANWAAISSHGSPEPVLAAPMAAAAGKLIVPRFTERERRMSSREYISERIDPILDKISLHGIGSLTDEERRTLENAREKISRQN